MPRIAFVAARPSGTQTLSVDFSDGSQATYSLMWLLDSCPEGFHAQTGERAFDLLSVPDAPLLRAAHILADGQLELHREHEGPASRFSTEWLSAHRHGVARPDAAVVAHRYWKAADLPDGAPRHDAGAILRDDTALLAWLADTKRYGLTIAHAYRAFMRLTREPAFRLTFKMRAGEMTAFDNRRILHGREAFDPATGNRHLHGCYVDRVEFDSRMRMLACR